VSILTTFGLSRHVFSCDLNIKKKGQKGGIEKKMGTYVNWFVKEKWGFD